jgi:hypothetical protein
MNTLFLKSDLEQLALIVAKLKESEATAEKWAAAEENISDKYAYKYGVMIGRVNAIADAFESRLKIIEESLEIETSKSIEFDYITHFDMDDI